MDANQWTPLLHELGTIIAAVAAAIAATSSLKNGRTLKNGRSDDAPNPPTKPKQKSVSEERENRGDWYQPPNLN